MICARGHRITSADLYVQPRNGRRWCRVCRREDAARARQERPDEIRARCREWRRKHYQRRERKTFWTPGRVRELRRMYVEERLPLPQIAFVLDKRQAAVRGKVYRLGLKRSPVPGLPGRLKETGAPDSAKGVAPFRELKRLSQEPRPGTGRDGSRNAKTAVAAAVSTERQ